MEPPRPLDELLTGALLRPAGPGREAWILALDEALDRLEAEDPIKATLVKLRYLTGMTIPQASTALGISHATAERYWAYSRAKLSQWIEGGADQDGRGRSAAWSDPLPGPIRNLVRSATG
jgi:DNA-directed RNA polymerase specialized sigma24 family protein